MEDEYDLNQEDTGNILSLEHINVSVPDQATATLFYVVGLGFTRDPYVNVGLENMWVNLGEQQFHLPTRPAQVIPGHIGIVIPSLDALRERLRAIEGRLAGTHFAWSTDDDCVRVTCPWGNHLRCYAPGPPFPDMVLGIPYVEFLSRPGTAAGIARFYQQVLGAPATTDGQEAVARVAIGPYQALVFRETEEELPAYDGHHIAIYVANFSGPYGFLMSHELISESIRNHQFRFQDLVDPETGARLFTLEHEVRGLRHSMYRRLLVNRDPTQTMRSYARGRDALAG